MRKTAKEAYTRLNALKAAYKANIEKVNKNPRLTENAKSDDIKALKRDYREEAREIIEEAQNALDALAGCDTAAAYRVPDEELLKALDLIQRSGAALPSGIAERMLEKYKADRDAVSLIGSMLHKEHHPSAVLASEILTNTESDKRQINEIADRLAYSIDELEPSADQIALDMQRIDAYADQHGIE